MDLQVAGNPYTKLQWTTQDIDAICDEHKIDVSNRKERDRIRRKVCKQIEQAHYDAWIETNKAVPAATVHKLAGTKRPHAQVSSDDVSGTNAQIDLSRAAAAITTSHIQSVNGSEGHGQDIPIDPALLALENTLAGANNEQTDRIEQELTGHVFDQIPQDETPQLTLPPLGFVQHFSSVNNVVSPIIYENHTAAAAVHTENLKPLRGNSRDPPSPFYFECENK